MRTSSPAAPVGPAPFLDGQVFETFGQPVPVRRRFLDARAVHSALPPPPEVEDDVLVQVLVDLSGSMIGGNDAAGLRFEATLVALEHLVGRSRFARRRKGRWHVQVLSFDLNSPLDLVPLELSRKTLPQVEAALLAPFQGGCSSLSASLRTAESTVHPAPRRLLVVLSDMELFGDPVDIFNRLAASSADVVLAVVFSSAVPAALGAPVLAHHVDPATADPAAVAHHLVAAAQRLVEQTTAVHA